jgi:hypothetical protein
MELGWTRHFPIQFLKIRPILIIFHNEGIPIERFVLVVRQSLEDKELTMDVFERYFEDAVRIYAICGDEELTDDDARLLTYMHAKACESGKGIEYFNDPSEHDEEALKVLTGDLTIGELAISDKGEVVPVSDPLTASMSDTIGDIDNTLKNEQGFENRISGELRHRLRLYRDPEFRTKMTEIYAKKISPRIFSCTEGGKEQSFRRYREKTENNGS